MATLIPNGELIKINGHKIHAYRCGHKNQPTLVFMAGFGTVAPIYDFKVLYKRLSEKFRIVVIEKLGYGYSDICESSCNIDALISKTRQVLDILQERKPYILVAHSMAGLEAIRWKQKAPDDIMAIIGIDMASPLTYSSWDDIRLSKAIKMLEIARKFRVNKIPFLYPLSRHSLSKDEIVQQRLLAKRNAFNICYINEAKEVLRNAKIVDRNGKIECPTLLFTSNGKQIDKDWVKCQRKFAASMNAQLIYFDCGHYIHHCKSNEMNNAIIDFVSRISR